MQRRPQRIVPNSICASPCYQPATREELCSSPEVDVVFVTSPDSMHKEDALLAIRHGKAVLCEKPLAMECAPEAAEIGCGCGRVRPGWSSEWDKTAATPAAWSGCVSRCVRALSASRSLRWRSTPILRTCRHAAGLRMRSWRVRRAYRGCWSALAWMRCALRWTARSPPCTRWRGVLLFPVASRRLHRCTSR